ncbi:MAG: Rrf2 family transcriptional regulator, partial [Nitratireductor sp.]
MRLNQASDFALRIMMLLATRDQTMTVDEISRQLLLVKSHVMKIVAKLARAQLLQSQRGRIGGVGLARPAKSISVGEIVRAIEADFATVECMREEKSTCVFLPGCKLRQTMNKARIAFLDVLDAQDLQS